jgi:AmiR/NasT family two-component response regulator
MSRSLRIAVADDELDMQEYFRDTLTRMGHQVVCVAGDGRTLARACETLRPDLVITDVKMPDMDGLEAAREICRQGPVPIVVVSAYHDQEVLERAAANHVFAYLVKPIRESNLAPAISIALRRYEEFQALHAEAADLRQALEDRKVIERAKGLLMQEAGIDEETAFRRLQKLASARNRKLVEMARMIVETAEAFRGPQTD